MWTTVLLFVAADWSCQEQPQFVEQMLIPYGREGTDYLFVDYFGQFTFPVVAYDKLKAMQTSWPHEPNMKEAQAREDIGTFVKGLGYSKKILDMQSSLDSFESKFASSKDSNEIEQAHKAFDSQYAALEAQPEVKKTCNLLKRISTPTLYALLNLEATPRIELIRLIREPGSSEFGHAWRAPNFSDLQKGDVLLRKKAGEIANFTYARDFSHAGIYAGDSKVYESTIQGGVDFHPLKEWLAPGIRLAHLRPLLSAWPNQVSVDEVFYRDGGKTPYNFNVLDVNTDDRLYCSQLVWKVGKHCNANLDSNAPSYIAYAGAIGGLPGAAVAWRAVAPDELFFSKDLRVLWVGVYPGKQD